MLPTAWGTPEEVERRRRILLTIWAYAYEFENVSLVPDHVFDEEARKVDLSQSTGSRKLDNFFKREFAPDTGMWIAKHPDLHRVRKAYLRHHKHPAAAASLPNVN